MKLYLAVLDGLTAGERIAQAAHAVTTSPPALAREAEASRIVGVRFMPPLLPEGRIPAL